jgi:mono/diheme cytochrome c family protein
MFAIVFSSCGGSAAPMTPPQRGRIVYMTNCVICHNANPNLPGTQGPPIAGSPRELVYDRVMFLKYPPGYKPKRITHAMRALPQLANRIDDLTAFLAEAAQQK